MLDIITVRVSIVEQILMVIVRVIMCSHSDKESYKNLRQSESRWLNWSCSCSNTITHYWHTETNTATTHELKTELRVKSAPLDCDLSWDFKARFTNHLIQSGTSKRVSRIICFQAGLQSAFRESFVSERDFKARFANHLIQSGTSKRVSRIICFRAGLQSAFRESFVSERDFKARFANHLFPSGTSKRVSRIICFRAGLQSAFRESFVSERDFKARFANHLFPSGTSKRFSRIICFRAGLQITHQRQGCWGGARGGLRGLKPRMFLLHALYTSSSLRFHAH